MGVRGVHAVRVYRGGPNGIAEATALTLVGPDITSSFGAAVGAGDVDGDGYADVIVGAPDANAGAGAVHVYLGGPTMLARKPSTTIAGPDVAFGGFGSVVAMAGDVNGDGFADVLVGAPESISKSGRAYLFLGGSSGLPLLPNARFDGATAGDSLGASVAGVGDLDGDGFADIAIGSPGIGASLGRVDVYRGSATGIDLVSRRTLTAPDGENFGAAIGGTGDTDGDGFADLIVGARGANHAYVFRGGATSVNGPACSLPIVGGGAAANVAAASEAVVRGVVGVLGEAVQHLAERGDLSASAGAREARRGRVRVERRVHDATFVAIVRAVDPIEARGDLVCPIGAPHRRASHRERRATREALRGRLAATSHAAPALAFAQDARGIARGWLR